MGRRIGCGTKRLGVVVRCRRRVRTLGVLAPSRAVETSCSLPPATRCGVSHAAGCPRRPGWDRTDRLNLSSALSLKRGFELILNPIWKQVGSLSTTMRYLKSTASFERTPPFIDRYGPQSASCKPFRMVLKTINGRHEFGHAVVESKMLRAAARFAAPDLAAGSSRRNSATNEW